jgi:hypothetical protein
MLRIFIYLYVCMYGPFGGISGMPNPLGIKRGMYKSVYKACMMKKTRLASGKPFCYFPKDVPILQISVGIDLSNFFRFIDCMYRVHCFKSSSRTLVDKIYLQILFSERFWLCNWYYTYIYLVWP